MTAKKTTKNMLKLKIFFFISNNLDCEIVKNMTIEIINLKHIKKYLNEKNF